MYKKEKRGQITIFIILAILIVVLVILFVFVIPKAKMTTTFNDKNPQAFIQTCLEDKIETTAETIALQGGSLAPEHYFTFNEIDIGYLCYTNENYKTCVIQKPLLKQNIESEIEDEIKEDVVNCFNALRESYERKNYDAQMEVGTTTIELLPKRIVVSFDYALTVSKGQTDRYDDFSVILNNNLYELIGITNSIVQWESTVGDADPRIYMTLYPDLRVDKNNRDDGTTIYVLTDKNTENKFQFASRSLVFPPGY